MILTWILLGAAVISLGIILYIIISKFPQLRSLDISTISREKERQTRDKILVDRIKRKTSKTKEVMLKGWVPTWAKFSDSLKNFYGKVQDLEKKYKREEAKSISVSSPEYKKKIDQLLDSAAESAKKEEFEDAEKKYIEIISLAPQEKRAYKGLGDLYMRRKEYKQALETYKFALKIDLKGSKEVIRKEDGREIKTFSNSIELADDHVDIGEAYMAMENYRAAVEEFKKAVQLEPNNPRNLDLLIEGSINAKNKSLAIDALNGLKRINPNNQKLKEYQEMISKMNGEKNSQGLKFLW